VIGQRLIGIEADRAAQQLDGARIFSPRRGDKGQLVQAQRGQLRLVHQVEIGGAGTLEIAGIMAADGGAERRYGLGDGGKRVIGQIAHAYLLRAT